MLNKPVYIWSRTSRLSTPLTLGRRGQPESLWRSRKFSLVRSLVLPTWARSVSHPTNSTYHIARMVLVFLAERRKLSHRPRHWPRPHRGSCSGHGDPREM